MEIKWTEEKATDLFFPVRYLSKNNSVPFSSLRRRGMEAAGINLREGGKAGTPREMITENIEAIEKNAGIKVGGVIGRINTFPTRPGAATTPGKNICCAELLDEIWER